VKQLAQRIFRETLAAIDIRAALARKLDRTGWRTHVGAASFDLRDFDSILAIAFGKAAFAMAEGLCDILAPDFAPEGILVTPEPPPRSLPRWHSFIGGHPTPTASSFAAGRAILDRLARAGPRSLVFFLVSGGGSAMVEQPLDPAITLEDFRTLNAALVTCGAPIEEINVIRKHLSAVKGGRLAAAAPDATKITFGVSDVPEGHESALASGPTIPDPTTIHDAYRIVDRYALLPKLPDSARPIFKQRKLLETPKEGHPAFARAHFHLLLRSHDLLHAAHRACEAAGFVSLCDESTDGWPLDRSADHLLSLLHRLQHANPTRPIAVIASGEVSSPVTGAGIGGRNSAFVLTCVPKIAGTKISVLSAGTDGIDGNSLAAGAVADGETLARARALGLDATDHHARSDAHTFFAKLGDAIITGPTGNNLRDLRILFAGESHETKGFQRSGGRSGGEKP
jgi:glycerate 2-kinase